MVNEKMSSDPMCFRSEMSPDFTVDLEAAKESVRSDLKEQFNSIRSELHKINKGELAADIIRRQAAGLLQEDDQ